MASHHMNNANGDECFTNFLFNIGGDGRVF
jgi:hypothetical protein